MGQRFLRGRRSYRRQCIGCQQPDDLFCSSALQADIFQVEVAISNDLVGKGCEICHDRRGKRAPLIIREQLDQQKYVDPMLSHLAGVDLLPRARVGFPNQNAP